MSPPRLPRMATWLLHSVLPPQDRDVVLGDLIEEYALRHSESAATAARWYWGQVCRSVPTVLLAGIRRGGALVTVVSALAAYVVVGTINFAGAAAIDWFVGATANSFAVSDVLVGLTAIAIGGYLAAWVRQGAATVLGALVVVVAVVLMASPSDTAPAWYQLTFLVLGPLAAHAGGVLRVSRRSDSAHTS
jgi:hypothetical protein